MGIGGQREGAEASVEKQYAQLSVADPVTTEHSCHFGGRRFCADLK